MFPLCYFNNLDKCFLVYGFFINYVLFLFRVRFLLPQSCDSLMAEMEHLDRMVMVAQFSNKKN